MSFAKVLFMLFMQIEDSLLVFKFQSAWINIAIQRDEDIGKWMDSWLALRFEQELFANVGGKFMLRLEKRNVCFLKWRRHISHINNHLSVPQHEFRMSNTPSSHEAFFIFHEMSSRDMRQMWMTRNSLQKDSRHWSLGLSLVLLFHCSFVYLCDRILISSSAMEWTFGMINFRFSPSRRSPPEQKMSEPGDTLKASPSILTLLLAVL